MINSNAILEINTIKLVQNFQSLTKIATKSLAGATIKANAYGIGGEQIFKVLYKNGCRHFFLATLEEAISIRKINSKGNVYVLNGLENNNLDIFKKYNIIPILISNYLICPSSISSKTSSPHLRHQRGPLRTSVRGGPARLQGCIDCD